MRLPLSIGGLLLAMACSHGGGAPGPAVPTSDPTFPYPSLSAGAGTAGALDGLWTVTAVDVVPDARTRNPDTTSSAFVVGDVIEFANGLVVESNDPTDPGDPSIQVHVEFLANDRVGALTRLGYGFHFDSSPVGPGATRVAAMLGTLDADNATGMFVQEDLYPGLPTPLDRFMVCTLTLERAFAIERLAPPAASTADAPHAPGLARDIATAVARTKSPR